MIFINSMKNLKIYKTPVFLPTLEDDKKRGSAILMMTPNYNSSKKLMNHPLFINKLRYSSYYIEKDVSYYINEKNIRPVEETTIINEVKFVNDKGDKVPKICPKCGAKIGVFFRGEPVFLCTNKECEKFFGVVPFRESVTESADLSSFTWYHLEPTKKDDGKRRDPEILGGWDAELYSKDMRYAIINDISSKFPEGSNEMEAYVYTAGDDMKSVYLGIITVYKYGEKEFDWEWSEQVDLSPKEVDRLKNEVHPSLESYDIETDYFVECINESSVLNLGDKLIFFNEDATNDSKLKLLLYKDRIRKRDEILELYEQVKKDCPFIKYTYPEISRYQKKNLFVDLYYYNQIFFKNNDWINNKGFRLYLDFMSRLINNPNLKEYKKKTIIIPIKDWGQSENLWNYRVSINPLSIIYHMMYSGMSSQLKDLFKDYDIIFMGSDNYFKINFSELDIDFKKLSITFKTFLMRVFKNEEFPLEDVDTTSDNSQSPEVIKANIVDKIELAKGVDLTSKLADAKKEKENKKSNKFVPKVKEEPKKETDSKISKGTLNKPKTEDQNKAEANKKRLAQMIDDIGDFAKSEEDALDMMDNAELKQILMDLDSGDDDKVNLTAGRSSRISELDRKLLETEIKGKSIKDILEPKEPVEKKVTNLNLSTPNQETWNNLSFVNFDKKYDIDKDIISIFRFFEFVSRPISIRNISVENNSTSEDRVELYTVEMEDYRGKRFTIKLDIPIMVDNRFLLRGNSKSIQTQFYNMPIIKTDFDTCQIISNYMKIFVRRFGSGAGKSLPITSRFIKAANKYKGRKIKFLAGDNRKICSKYELPIDYIDLSGLFSKIETEDFIVYFNQDEIRKVHQVEEGLGVPYLYNKKSKSVVYYDYATTLSFTSVLLDQFRLIENNKYQDFLDLFDSASTPSVCTFSRCSIMDSQIPLVVICAYHEGLRKTLEKGQIAYRITSTLSKEDRHNDELDWIKFKDGYIIYRSTYDASLLMNGLKVCPTELFEIADIDNKNMYLEFLDDFGGRIKADGLDNFYDLMLDPMTVEVLKVYKFPTDYVSILLYTNALLADNKFIKHTDASSRRFRRYELIAVYTYKVLSDAYASYANQLRHSREAAEFSVKQSAVIDRFLLDSITSDDSCINALREVETTNAITTKGPSGMNSDRAYSLDKRTYDESMLNVLGMSTGFSANVGITRQATIDANIEGERGYVKSINGNTEKMNTSKSLTATEALTPFGSTRDDPMRTAMTFIQTAKHMVRTEDSDPLLVTSGADEAMPYLTSDKFAFKAKNEGKVLELTNEYILVEYIDGTKDYINLVETIEKNSDGGYYVPLKLDAVDKLKVGSKISENQILAYDKYSFSNSLGESENIAYNIGKLAKVAIINTDEGFEDSGIITEKMANKLATRVNLKFNVTIDKETDILSIAKVGDKVEVGDNLLVWQAPFDDEEANSLMKSLTGEDVSELGKRKLKSEVTGVITAIKIFRTIELEDMSDSLRTIVDNYEKPLRALKDKLASHNLDTSQVPAHYILEPTGKLKKAQNAVIFEFYVEYKDTVGIGDKVVYFSANKAIEKSIIPMGLEPYTDFRPNESIDAFVSEVSIDKRMVTSTMIYGSLQKLMIELDRSVKDIMRIPYDDSVV